MNPQAIPKFFQDCINAGKVALSTKDAAIAIDFKEQTLRVWASKGTAPHGIRPQKIGNRLRWRIEDLIKLVGGAQ